MEFFGGGEDVCCFFLNEAKNVFPVKHAFIDDFFDNYKIGNIDKIGKLIKFQLKGENCSSASNNQTELL